MDLKHLTIYTVFQVFPQAHVETRDASCETDIFTTQQTFNVQQARTRAHTIRTIITSGSQCVWCLILPALSTRKAHDRLLHFHYWIGLMALCQQTLRCIHKNSQITAVSGSDDIKNYFEFIMILLLRL